MYYQKNGTIIKSDLNLNLPKATEQEWKTQKAPTYTERRRAAYPALSDQLDLIYWDKVNGTNVWQETIAEIKAKYPKG